MKTTIKMSPVDMVERKKLDMRAGDTVRVTVRIPEKDKIRLQAFEGFVLVRKHGTESGATFTVRKVASGVGLERIFPLYSPTIEKIEILKRTKTRRSKLYYIREKANREIRRKMRNERRAYEYSIDEKDDILEEDVVKETDVANEILDKDGYSVNVETESKIDDSKKENTVQNEKKEK